MIDQETIEALENISIRLHGGGKIEREHINYIHMKKLDCLLPSKKIVDREILSRAMSILGDLSYYSPQMSFLMATLNISSYVLRTYFGDKHYAPTTLALIEPVSPIAGIVTHIYDLGSCLEIHGTKIVPYLDSTDKLILVCSAGRKNVFVLVPKDYVRSDHREVLEGLSVDLAYVNFKRLRFDIDTPHISLDMDTYLHVIGLYVYMIYGHILGIIRRLREEKELWVRGSEYPYESWVEELTNNILSLKPIQAFHKVLELAMGIIGDVLAVFSLDAILRGSLIDLFLGCLKESIAFSSSIVKILEHAEKYQKDH